MIDGQTDTRPDPKVLLNPIRRKLDKSQEQTCPPFFWQGVAILSIDQDVQ